jgi:Ala-tRNA(Pro) deacylase
MPAQRLREFLDSNGVKYVTVRHSKAFTAQEVAASAHIPGREMAKTVIIRIDGKMAMAVVPATTQVDLHLLSELTGASGEIELAEEQDFQDLFPECELGAMPPFGNLYDMDVFVAQRLRENDEIAFNAGNHTELIRMSYSDFERLVKPYVLQFASVAY